MKIRLILGITTLLTLLSSCTSNNVDKFSYEIRNGEKHIEVTKKNLIHLIDLNDNELKKLLQNIQYEKNPKGNVDFSFIQKTDTVSGVFQTIEVRYNPNRIIDVTWVSLDKKDRFEKFRAEIESSRDIHIPKQDAFILKQDDKKYLAAISDLIIAKRISISNMD